MSWWTNVRDGIEKAATLGLYDPKESRRLEADQRYAMNDQIRDYKELTAITKAETDRKRGEQAMEKRRIEEKQIRSLRRNFRPAGFLDNAAGVNEKLGG